MIPKPLLLIILDGWGHNPSSSGNAIAQARKPTWDRLLREFPNTLIHTSGPYVGLPEGQMGNSEVGHLNIGSGRIILMDITRIDRMIETGEFFRQLVEADPDIRRTLPPAEIAAAFDLNRQLRHVDAIFARVFGDWEL